MKYGYVPDLPDFRDLTYQIPLEQKSFAKVDLRTRMPAVYDQSDLGSCTSQALAAAVEYDHMCQSQGTWIPSRLFIYFNEREIEGTIPYDSGAQIRDGIKTLATNGVCHETLWPYDIQYFTKRPPITAYKDAIKYTAVKYMRVPQTLSGMKSALKTNIPIILGISLYESFETPDVARTGIVPMPSHNERLLGGHAVLCVGYDDSRSCFIMRNSWGENWGDKGYFYIPYDYLTNPDLCQDLWVINLVK